MISHHLHFLFLLFLYKEVLLRLITPVIDQCLIDIDCRYIIYIYIILTLVGM
jgi:hypothetical protein